MNDKSYVTMEQHQCPVCGLVHDTGNLLLDKRLKPQFDRHTVTGWGMCPEHQKLRDDGYIALIEMSAAPEGASAKLEDTWSSRTGNLAHVRASAWANIFDQPLPPKGIAFVEVGVIEALQAKVSA